MKPRIGLSMDEETSPGGGAYYFIKESYLNAVREAGGNPIALARPSLKDPLEITALLNEISGLVITGGNFDIDPAHYGATNAGETRRILSRRTDFEWQLAQLAIDRGMPVLGVCGGMQLLNVMHGGTLLQHVDHHENTAHAIQIERATYLNQIMNCGAATQVNSSHHQAVDRLGNNLVISSRAADGVIESFECQGCVPEKFMLGVQWHPENATGQNHAANLAIYRALVAAAARQPAPQFT